MSTTKAEDTVTFKCKRCDYENHWTLDEIYQFGREEAMRGDKEDHYSLKCKNPQDCPQRRIAAVPRRRK